MQIKRIITAVSVGALLLAPFAYAKKPLDDFQAYPPVHVNQGNGNGGNADNSHGHGGGGGTVTQPTGLSPQTIRTVYNLPAGGGAGTIAIIDAFDDPYVEKDLGTFSSKYGLPSCTTANGCFEKHQMAPRIRASSGWGLEESLDVEWAHAIAPSAKVLLVEARSNGGNDLLAAVDYARQRADVVAVSMSWGGAEFSGESAYDSYFSSPHEAFFASSGDSGAGVEWPAVSANVTGVGGTTLNFLGGSLLSETAWSGSGGGVSAFEPAPAYQTAYGVPNANGMRAVPDVSYDADPASGVSVYDSYGYNGWLQVGGTSAGAPQWAAIHALGTGAANGNFYADASNATTYAADFRDILSGANGSCSTYCTAGAGYDYVTGLGSPLAVAF